MCDPDTRPRPVPGARPAGRGWGRRLARGGCALALGAALCFGPGPSQAAEPSGVVRLFVEKPGSREAQPEAEVQLRLRTKRRARTRAVVKLEGRYFERDVAIKDAYLDHKLSRSMRLRLGIDKKALGLEYEEPSRYRLTLHRTHIYQSLESMGLVGRQLQLGLRTRPERGREGVYGDVAVGVDGSRNSNLLGSLRYQAGAAGLGSWGLLERHRIEHTYLAVWAAAASAWLDTGRWRIATEMFAGVDADASEFQRQWGDGQRVVFYGPRSELALRWPLSPRWSFEPFVQGALLAHDARRPAYGHRAQALLGLNLRSKPLVLRTAAELVSEHNAGPREVGSFERRMTYYASVAYSF